MNVSVVHAVQRQVLAADAELQQLLRTPTVRQQIEDLHTTGTPPSASST